MEWITDKFKREKSCLKGETEFKKRMRKLYEKEKLEKLKQNFKNQTKKNNK